MTHWGATEMAFESYSPDVRDRACLLRTPEKKIILLRSFLFFFTRITIAKSVKIVFSPKVL